MEKIKCIFKEVNEKHGRVMYIPNNDEYVRNLFGGEFDVIPVFNDIKIICNEKSCFLGAPANFLAFISGLYDVVFGTAIICSIKDGKFTDISISLEDWKLILEAWGN